MCNINISNLLPADYTELISLWERAGLPYKPNGRDEETNILEQLKEKNNFFIKATDNNRIVGFVIASHNKRKGWINRLAVDPDYQHQGLASQLITEAEHRFLQAGIKIFACLIENWNTSSMSIFTKNNYIVHKDIFYFTKKIEKNI